MCIDAARDAPCQSGHCHPFVGLGWGDTAPSGTTDRTATGLCRQAPIGHCVRPAGVEWVTGPGRRIELKTVPKDVSRFAGVRPGLGTHPHADQSVHRSGGSFSGHFESSLPGLGAPNERHHGGTQHRVAERVIDHRLGVGVVDSGWWRSRRPWSGHTAGCETKHGGRTKGRGSSPFGGQTDLGSLDTQSVSLLQPANTPSADMNTVV